LGSRPLKASQAACQPSFVPGYRPVSAPVESTITNDVTPASVVDPSPNDVP